MKKRLASLLMVVALITSALAILPVIANPACKLKVEPASFVYWSATTPVGTPFTVSIIAEDIPSPGMYGWQFWLYWDAGKINLTTETINFNFWPSHSSPYGPGKDNVAGTYMRGMSASAGPPPDSPFIGTVWLVNLTFILVKEAPWGSAWTTALDLGPPAGMIYCLVDSSSSEIPHDYVNGSVTYIWSPPTINPYVEVEYTGEPGVHEKTFYGKNIYKTPFSFSIDIRIKNLDAGWMLAGIECLFFYNKTLLNVTSIQAGDFLDPFTSPGGTWFTSAVYDPDGLGKIRIGYAILDIPDMTAPHGEGLVARITFNAIYQELAPKSVTSPLDIQVDTEAGMHSYFVDFLSNEMVYDPEVDGKYTLAGYTVGRVIDVFTQYLYPYGGQGPMAPSDMFWPQKQVELYANVTYNDWPVQNKPVSFEVREPHGIVMTVLTGITDANGIAHVSFRMDWPCVNPEDLFGLWTVTATVDIACIVVNDTLQFHYDYLVHWWKVTTDKEQNTPPNEYKHCEYVYTTITFGSYAMQNYWVLITETIHDELNYPIWTGTTWGWVQIGGAVWCQYKNYTITLVKHVDKNVAAGDATIHVSALTTLPSLGGAALCPEITKRITILAKWV